MKRITLLFGSLAVVLLAAALFLRADGASHQSVADDGDISARALIRNAAGDPVGVAKLTQEDGEVLVRVTVHDPRPAFTASTFTRQAYASHRSLPRVSTSSLASPAVVERLTLPRRATSRSCS